MNQLYDPDQIDITLLDLRLNGQNGAITCQNLQRKYPGIKIIIISFSEDPDLILQMIRYGGQCIYTKRQQYPIRRTYHPHGDAVPVLF